MQIIIQNLKKKVANILSIKIITYLFKKRKELWKVEKLHFLSLQDVFLIRYIFGYVKN
jgi:hypothetical protein